MISNPATRTHHGKRLERLAATAALHTPSCRTSAAAHLVLACFMGDEAATRLIAEARAALAEQEA